jgi:hypothetical protein
MYVSYAVGFEFEWMADLRMGRISGNVRMWEDGSTRTGKHQQVGALGPQEIAWVLESIIYQSNIRYGQMRDCLSQCIFQDNVEG